RRGGAGPERPALFRPPERTLSHVWKIGASGCPDRPAHRKGDPGGVRRPSGGGHAAGTRQSRHLQASHTRGAAPMKRHRQRLFILSFLGPPFALYALFVLLPAFNALRYSLLRWDGLGQPAWVGLKNFQAILAPDSGFPKALGNNLFLMFVPGPIILTLALFF